MKVCDAIDLIKAGLSVIPIATAGQKSPVVKWHTYQTRRPTGQEAESWWSGKTEFGAAVILGAVSGNLCCLDFESKASYKTWAELVGTSVDALGDLPVVESPRGYHVYLRLAEEAPDTRLVLAWTPDPEGQGASALIEFHGKARYMLIPGCPPGCHPDGGVYEHRGGTDLAECPQIDGEALQRLLEAGRSLNAWTPAKRTQGVSRDLPASDARPGTDYCQRGEAGEWTRLLKLAGGELVQAREGRELWRRPGKEKGISATLGVCNGQLGPLFYVFTPNWPPFEVDRAYSLFAVRALVEHEGDWRTCAAKCAAEGYGPPPGEEVRDLVADQVQKNRKLLEEGARSLTPRKILDAWIEADDLLRATMRKKRRKDFGDDDDLYINSLLFWARRNRYDPTDETQWVREGLRLVHDYLVENGGIVEKASRVDYLARKIASVERYRQEPEGTAQRRIKEDEVCDDREKMLAYIRDQIYLPALQSIEYTQEKGLYLLRFSDGSTRVLGPESCLDSSRTFTRALRELDLEGYNWPGDINPEIKSGQGWANFRAIWYRCRRILHRGEALEDVLELLRSYIQAAGLVTDQGDRNWREAVGTTQAIQLDDVIHVRLQELLSFAAVRMARRITSRELTAEVLRVAIDRHSVILTGVPREAHKPRPQARYWRIPVSVLANGSEEEAPF